VKKSVIKSAKTVEEAINLALIELNTARDNIEVDIIEPPSSGFLGLIGVKPAIIKVTELVSGLNSDSRLPERTEKAVAVKTVKEVQKAPKQQKAKPASQQDTKQAASPKQNTSERKPATEAQEQEIVSFVQQLANHIVEGSTAELVSTEEGIMHIAISGDNIGLIVGKHGETLNAIQYLTSLVYSKQRDGYHRVSIDAGGYRDKRKEKIIEFSKRMAEKARRTGRRISLEPMNSYERRIIHMALQEVEGINTFSEGDDPNRRVVIVAAGGDRSNRRYQRRPSNRNSKQNNQTEEQNQAAHEERNYQATEKQRVQLESRTKAAPEPKVSEPPKKPAKVQKPKQDKKVAETKTESNPYEHYYSKYDNRVKKK